MNMIDIDDELAESDRRKGNCSVWFDLTPIVRWFFNLFNKKRGNYE